MKFNYVFGIEGRFGLDVTFSTWGLDQEALLKLKEKPGRMLKGRVYEMALRDSCGREVDKWHERIWMKLAIQNNLLVYDDVIDDEPDVIDEHLSEKALHRKHRASERYRKVRQDRFDGGHFDLRTAKKELRRSSRRKLNNMAVFTDKDYVGKHGSYFSDVEKWSVRGWRNLGGKVEVDG